MKNMDLVQEDREGEEDMIMASEPEDDDGDGGDLEVDENSEWAPIAEKLTATYNILPEVEGSALYPAISIINHSCDANVAIQFEQDSWEASIVAVKDIAAGEEVLFSKPKPCTFRV